MLVKKKFNNKVLKLDQYFLDNRLTFDWISSNGKIDYVHKIDINHLRNIVKKNNRFEFDEKRSKLVKEVIEKELIFRTLKEQNGTNSI